MNMLNIFKKKKSNPLIKPKTVLCIPCKWKNHDEVVASIATTNMNKFIFAGKILMNTETGKSFELEICERDERMRESFEVAGLVNRLSDEFLDKIEQHSSVIYIVGETGNPDDATAIAEAGNALLKAGGIGLKVESAGKAFTAEHWTKLLTNFEEPRLYEMFVLDSLNDGEGTTYSCGMHNLGLKDTIISGVEFQEAYNSISIFGYYQWVDKPTIVQGETFGVDNESPSFEIVNEPNQPNKGHELFENPYGMWRLKRKQ
jgi:hypothetical protein